MRSLLAIALASALCAAAPAAENHLIYLGTYTNTESRGIYRIHLDATTGALSTPELAAEARNPSFLDLHPTRPILYAIDESDSAGGVTAFHLDRSTGNLTRLNAESTGSGGIAHLAIDRDARFALVASYGRGYTAAFPLAPDGRLQPRTSLIQHEGPLGPHTNRQEKPHAHSVTFSPDNRFAYVADLGLDRVLAFSLDPAAGTIARHPAGDASVPPGAGPRHSKFSHDGKHFYVLNELDTTLSTFRHDPATGALSPVQTLSTIPPGYDGRKSCAEIRIHPNDRFVYASNRSHDSLTVFARNPETGELTLVQNIPSGGAIPRNFALSPDGRWLVCAHQDSNSLSIFRVDPDTGLLTATPHRATIPRPVCVLFVP
jgi:3-carboxymuconate cyclase